MIKPIFHEKETILLKFLIGLLITFTIFVVIFKMMFKILKKLWFKMHDIVGLTVKSPPQIDSQPTSPIPQPIPEKNIIPHQTETYWQLKQGKVKAMQHLVGINADKLNLMPTEAVVILSRINDKISRYTAWQQEVDKQSATWLTEQKYAIKRLIDDAIPTAVNHFDQLARFNPHTISQKIHHEMTAADVLIDVLLDVDHELDKLLDDLTQQTASQLATTHRYVKSRTQ